MEKKVKKILQEMAFLQQANFRDSESFFCKSVAQLASCELIDSKGRLCAEKFDSFLTQLPCQYLFQEKWKLHVKKVFTAFLHDKEMVTLYQRLRMPLASDWVRQLIAFSVGKQPEKITGLDLKRCVFAALLMPIRQNVGSCFATATAIYLQESQIKQVLKDLLDLTSLRLLKRVVHEEEVKFPIGVQLGRGELQKVVGNKGRLAFHVGWLQSAAKIGLIPSNTAYNHKIEAFTKVLDSLDVVGLSFEGVLQTILLYKHGLKESELKMPMPMQAHTPFTVLPSRLGKNRAKIEEYNSDKEAVEALLMNFSQHALLKAWEYCIASFVDYDSSLTKASLTSSLGLEKEAPFGIGEAVYNRIQMLLEEAHTQAQEHHNELILAQDRVTMAQRLLSSADNQDKARRLKTELQMHLHHMHSVKDMRDRAVASTEEYSKFFAFLMEQYHALFVLYFQEIYDPNLRWGKEKDFEDSAAGFRLAYKHGRADPSVWTCITSEKEYINCLVDFFKLTESLIINVCEWEQGKEEVVHITTMLSHYVQESEFCKHAFLRVLEFQKKYIKGRHAITLYESISGGTIHTLLKGYFGLQRELSDESFLPKDPQELCIYLIDFVKGLSLSLTDKLTQSTEHSLLMYSPTHVFLFKPGLCRHPGIWENQQFTYTWLRDQYLEPTKRFYGNIHLSQEQQEYLYQKMQIDETGFTKKLFIDGASIQAFILEHLHVKPEKASSLLFESLPLLSLTEQREVCNELGCDEAICAPIIGAKNFLYKLLASSTISQEELIRFFYKKKLLPPEPLIMADTNWEESYFAFVLNPISLNLELWRVSIDGMTGNPMVEWSQEFGREEPPSWGIFPNPDEYCTY